MTTDERIATLEADNAKLFAAFNTMSAFYEKHELWLKEKGIWDHLVQDVLSRVPTAPAATPPVPAATPDGIPGLSASQVAAVNQAMNNGVAAGLPIAGARDAIQTQLGSGTYSYGDSQIISAVKLWYYNGASDNDKSALYPYLAIIDQRDANNQPLPAGDPRWVKVGAAAPSAPAASGQFGVGLSPDGQFDAGLQIGGSVGAEILGVSNTRGTDGQNPGEVHKNVLSVAGNDGGMRLIQYGGWGPGGLKRNTTNRPMTILALDSMGDLCISDSRVPYGQVFYIRKDPDAKTITISTFQPGWKLQLRESSVYGASDIPVGGT